MQDAEAEQTSGPVERMEPRFWQKNGWIAKVIKNEDDDGWAVEMTRVGDSEPTLVGPWTMGRDKKNPKPMDLPSFNTLVKTASDVIQRNLNNAYNLLHKTLSYTNDAGERIRAKLDITPDEDEPHAILTVTKEYTDEELRKGRVHPRFKLNATAVEKFLREGSRFED